jgi:coat protein Gp5
MPNTTLTADIIAAEAVMILENELVMAKKVHRGYEDEFDKKVNGYTVGETISIRKPADFTVRTGATRSDQDVTEGKLTFTVNQQAGVDFKFSSADLTLDIKDLGERVMKPALVQLANYVDAQVMSLYKEVPNWVGTPGQLINSFADFFKGPERLNEFGVPEDERYAVLSPADHAAMLGSQTALYMTGPAESAYRKANLGNLGGVEVYMAQNVPTHTVGSAADTSAVADAAAGSGVLSTTYETVKDLGYMYLSTDGWDASTLKYGDILELSGVYAVNPVTKATLPFLRQFSVLEDTTTASGDTAIKLVPPIITSGAFQTVSAVPVDGSTTIDKIGTGGTGYRQNMVFHKNAFGLVMVPMVEPPGAVDVARKTYKGTSVRVIPTYDGVNDVSSWRLDILFGKKALDGRLATRLSGTA